MPAPMPPSTSTMALTGEARKKRPGHELPRSGSKKKKKIAAVHEAPAENAVEAVLASESDKTKCLSGSAKRKLKKQQPKKEDSNGTAAEKEQEAPIEQDKIEMTLEDYEKVQENKKSLEASKPEERRVVDVDFEGLQLLEKNLIEDNQSSGVLFC
ncbi:uncharacterized protein [Triticum aestivum]|uniref:uncharacterized protein n=1 Tax=Triticum aestivum TaxID=4565 RepID=UPI001D0076B1|nr:uncharacterized protein LOC123064486 [Triticum aestivum]